MGTNDWKRLAAEHAMQFVEPGMRLGLGTGSTASKFIELLGAKTKLGLDVVCVPTSEATRRLAQSLDIKLSTLDQTPDLDLTIDGADEIDNDLRLIKGGGGSLLREKIVATASKRVVIIADHTKRVENLGAFPLPIEVTPFGLTATERLIVNLAGDCGCEGPITLRKGPDGGPYVTDNGNLILDCAFGLIEDPDALDDSLRFVPGIVENGLFIGVADVAVVVGPMGCEILKDEDDPETSED